MYQGIQLEERIDNKRRNILSLPTSILLVQAGQHPQMMLSSQCVPSGQSEASILGTHSTNEQSGHKGRDVVVQ